ncbi:MAG: 30S ribosomal protein S16 [Candidatus Taylorbacteria bacterium]|nr:30S ribosomal protein S16 [Candidatus Taylorbacteria bacterium]
MASWIFGSGCLPTDLLTFRHSFASIRTMLKIRLQRVGRVHATAFRLVLTDSKNGPKSGKSLEVLGSYNPQDKNNKIENLNGEKVKYWISKGAQPSDTVHNLLIDHKIITAKKRNALPLKRPIKTEVKEEAKVEATKEVAPAPEVPKA